MLWYITNNQSKRNWGRGRGEGGERKRGKEEKGDGRRQASVQSLIMLF